MLQFVPDTWQAEVLVPFFPNRNTMHRHQIISFIIKFIIKFPVYVLYSSGVMNFSTFSILLVISLI